MLLAGTDAILLFCENSSITLKSAAEFPYGALWLAFFFCPRHCTIQSFSMHTGRDEQLLP